MNENLEYKKVDQEILDREVKDREEKLSVIREVLGGNKYGFEIKETERPSKFEIYKDDTRLGVIKFSDHLPEKSNPVEFLSVDVDNKEKPGLIVSSINRLQVAANSFLEGLNAEYEERKSGEGGLSNYNTRPRGKLYELYKAVGNPQVEVEKPSEESAKELYNSVMNGLKPELCDKFSILYYVWTEKKNHHFRMLEQKKAVDSQYEDESQLFNELMTLFSNAPARQARLRKLREKLFIKTEVAGAEN